MKNLARRFLSRLGYKVVRQESFDNTMSVMDRYRKDIALIKTMPEDHWAQMLGLLPASRAQLRQDLFVLSRLGLRQDGFFVEFGATDGVELSNTHLLETRFGWRGILAEPARCWHERLQRNRSATIETRCIWRNSGQRLAFNEAGAACLSTIDDFSGADVHARRRGRGKVYDVETLSLHDMLDQHGAPGVIDYLSIDTEGSELDILQAFDFDRYRFRIITCEHNYMPQRELIHDLLARHGYRRVQQELSEFDDWYIGPDVSTSPPN